MNIQMMEKIIEAILFASGDAIAIEKLAIAIEQDLNTTRKIILKLKDYYDLNERGIKIIETNNSFQMCTREEYYKYIINISKNSQKKHLTETQLETLSIIAYKQPITKVEIESIRGVRCDHVINKLIEYSLVCEKGRLQAPGKPILFGTTDNFLKFFGLKNINELPDLQEESIK